jgi:hypothetical protein
MENIGEKRLKRCGKERSCNGGKKWSERTGANGSCQQEQTITT